MPAVPALLTTTRLLKPCRSALGGQIKKATKGAFLNAIVQGHKLFTNANGRPWNRRSVAKRFERVKEIAACLKRPVRQEITIYDFRHLWISEAITCVDVFTVAKMAGTSVTMIERTYGHLANKHFQDAQRLVDAKRSSRKTSKTLGETVAEPA